MLVLLSFSILLTSTTAFERMSTSLLSSTNGLSSRDGDAARRRRRLQVDSRRPDAQHISSCAASSGAQAELNAARAAWFGKEIQLSQRTAFSLEDRRVTFSLNEKIERCEILWYRITNGTLMKRIQQCSKADQDDVATVEALLTSTLERFEGSINDAEFIVFVGDFVKEIPSICQKMVCFAFSSARRGQQHSLVGFPNPFYTCYALRLMNSTDSTIAKMMVPWERKKSQAFFSGALTKGTAHTAKEVRELPRVRLANIAARNDKDLVVFFTDLDWFTADPKKFQMTHPDIRKVLLDASHKLHGHHHDVVDFFKRGPKFKYLLDVDGVTVSWRAYQLLAAESVLLLQDSDLGEFFFQDMKPWVHYVPVAHDLSDLLHKIQYLRDHDDEALKIAREARLFWMRDLNFGATQCWALSALKFAAQVTSTVLPSGNASDFQVVHKRDIFSASMVKACKRHTVPDLPYLWH
eukprot:gnl/MRDRNA2_/MRDRNA2_128309_c0_seq1.p1 gnl/MRDRNA2_/MRDRNA2_128309_c0~~gnl/MRDRNA2_/MRDRNA2_128309_c0_seq1.p1  ORF type:complete len:465 (+),score=78.81 gnl/MRDRNA2_/MRDRNA2_128309_c0_seq1:113-1507(+)